jgi:CelD/BcsL family acetyltransferase involved in cellulose biosynthesis
VSGDGPALLLLADLGTWAAQWDQLVESSPLASPFLRSWWLAGACPASGKFVLVVSAGELLGGLAVQEERILGMPCVRMMGSGVLCPDHLDLLCADGHPDVVVAAVAGWLSRPGQRIVDLAGLRAGALVSRALPGRVRSEEMPCAPWAPLGMTASQYLASRPASLRKTLRKTRARLSADGTAHRVLRGAAAIAALEGLGQLHADQWGAVSRFLPGFAQFRAACAGGARADEVAVHELQAGAVTVAVLVSFEVAGRVSLYQSARQTAFQWRDATPVLLASVVADACDRGFGEVDFLRGDEPYKASFASERRHLLRLQAASGRAGVAGLAVVTAARRARRLAAGAVTRRRAAAGSRR